MTRSTLLVAFMGLAGATIAGDQGTTKNAAPRALEDVYVVRARPTGPQAPVTSYCDAARFPESHPVQQERPYEILSTNTNAMDGKVTNAAVQRLGQLRGCYSARIDGKNYSYGKGTLAGIPFMFRGSCTVAPARDPAPDVTSYACDYTLSELPPGYVGGHSLWNGITTEQDGYLTTTIATIRLWRKR